MLDDDISKKSEIIEILSNQFLASKDVNFQSSCHDIKS